MLFATSRGYRALASTRRSISIYSMVISATALLAVLRLGGTFAQEVIPARQTAERLPAPPAADQARAEKTVQEVFAAELAARSAAARTATANKFLDAAQKTTGDPASQYVLLRDAMSLAVEGGNAELAWTAIDRLAASFQVDGSKLREEQLAALAKEQLAREPADRAAKYAMGEVEAAIAKDDYVSADRLAATARSLATKSQIPATIDSVRERTGRIHALEEQHKRALIAIKAIHTRPDDAEAQEVVGEYLCFGKGDWHEGLPHLKKGTDPALCRLAEQDLGAPDTAAKQKLLADGWWDAATTRAGPIRAAIRLRAAAWYAKSADGLSGLAQVMARKRITEAGNSVAVAVAPSPRTLNLLALVDVRRDTVVGGWKLERGVLKSDGGENARLMIPYVPPKEYDFLIEFTRISGRDQVFQIFPAGQSQLIWSMGSWGKQMRLSNRDGDLNSVDDPACTDPGKLFSSLVRVRTEKIEVFLNGKRVAVFSGDLGSSPLTGDASLPDPEALGIGSWYGAPAAFSKLVLVEVSGQGHLIDAKK